MRTKNVFDVFMITIYVGQVDVKEHSFRNYSLAIQPLTSWSKSIPKSQGIPNFQDIKL